MKIAIVLSGRSRFIEESGFWWKNNIIKQNPDIEFDFYCHFWNDNEIDLDKKIVDTFNTRLRVLKTESYSEWYENFSQKVLDYNKDYMWPMDILPDQKYFNVLDYFFFEVAISRRYRNNSRYNFYGQYVSSGKGVELIGKEKINEYDLVLKTRSDLCIDPDNFSSKLANLYEGIKFHNRPDQILRDPRERELLVELKKVNPEISGPFCVFSQPFSLANNMAYPPDLIFTATPSGAWNYFSNMEDRIFKLLTESKDIIFGAFNKYNYCWSPAHVVWPLLTIPLDKNIYKIYMIGINELYSMRNTLFRKCYADSDLLKIQFEDIDGYNRSEEFATIRSGDEWYLQ